MFVVDSIQNVAVDENKYMNEISALRNFVQGFCHLYKNILPYEDQLKKTDTIIAFGNIPSIPDELVNLFQCFFHWYGTSVINYARLAGLVINMSKGTIKKEDIETPEGKKNIKTMCDNYLNSINDLKDILVWRHKVAAHFSITVPHNTDNPATLEASIMYPVTFIDGRFYTGAYKLTKSTETGTVKSEIPKWSLTESYERLSERFYWPHVTILKPH